MISASLFLCCAHIVVGSAAIFIPGITLRKRTGATEEIAERQKKERIFVRRFGYGFVLTGFFWLGVHVLYP